MSKEFIVFSDYIVTEKRPSKYIPDLYITEAVGVRCPLCDAVNKMIERGDDTVCVCGLHMQVFGNALYIWK